MVFVQGLTDDQTALIGCGAVLLLAFLVMTLSYHVGVLVRGGRVPQGGAPEVTPRGVASQGISRRRAA